MQKYRIQRKFVDTNLGKIRLDKDFHDDIINSTYKNVDETSNISEDTERNAFAGSILSEVMRRLPRSASNQGR